MRLVEIIVCAALLITVFTFGNPKAPTSDQVFDNFDVAYYKLSVNFLDGENYEDTADTFSGVKAIFRTIVNIFKAPQWLFDIVTSTRFLFTANYDYNTSYGNGHREYVYSSSYGWLVCPNWSAVNLSSNKYYTPRFPDSVFYWNPFAQTWEVDGVQPVIGGGTR